MKRIRVKIFQAGTAVSLEEKMNKWLGEEALQSVMIEDIKYGFHKDANGTSHFAYIQHYY